MTRKKTIREIRSSYFRIFQKTKGLSLKQEKKTDLSLPEKKSDLSREKLCRNTWTASSEIVVLSMTGNATERKKIVRCFSGENVKLSVNWILLSKSSQHPFVSKWAAAG